MTLRILNVNDNAYGMCIRKMINIVWLVCALTKIIMMKYEWENMESVWYNVIMCMHKKVWRSKCKCIRYVHEVWILEHGNI